MSHIHTSGKFEAPHFGHAWRGKDGSPHASVDFGDAWVEFSDSAAARDAAAACTQAAEAIEALPPAQDGDES